jgi:hypothetical protein
MRLHLALLLIGLLALLSLPTDAAGRYTILGIGAESCGKPLPGGVPDADARYGVALAALVHLTCNLDSVLLQMEEYGRGNGAEDLAGTFSIKSQRVRPGR